MQTDPMLNKIRSTSMKTIEFRACSGFRFDRFGYVVGFGLADTDAAVFLPDSCISSALLGYTKHMPAKGVLLPPSVHNYLNWEKTQASLSAELYLYWDFYCCNCLRRGRGMFFHMFRCHTLLGNSWCCQIHLNFGLNGVGGRFA